MRKNGRESSSWWKIMSKILVRLRYFGVAKVRMSESQLELHIWNSRKGLG